MPFEMLLFCNFVHQLIELRRVGGRSTAVGETWFSILHEWPFGSINMLNDGWKIYYILGSLLSLAFSLSLSLFQSVDIFVCVINCFCVRAYVCPLNKLIRIGIPRVSFWTQDPLIRFPKGCTIVLCVPNSCGLHIDRPRVVENRRWDWGKCARVKFV